MELKPCPFCGGRAFIAENEELEFLPWVICSDCGCETNCFRTVEEAIKAWNRRTNEQT